MSSTNVHSNKKHICGGQTIPKETNERLEMPPQSAGRGPSILEVLEGPNAEISVYNNIVVKEGKKVIGRATTDGHVLSGDVQQVKNILNRDNAR